MSKRPSFPPLVDNDSAYQNGILDVVHEREPLTCVLAAAQQPELMLAYARGMVRGRELTGNGEQRKAA